LSEVERVQLKKNLFELVVKKWVELWRWQSNVIEKKLKERNEAVKRRHHVLFEVTMGLL
jgi:hypothetical protein